MGHPVDWLLIFYILHLYLRLYFY